jgi:two-component system phosphate regulon response regulator PhoB
MMPGGVSGVDLCRRLKRDENLAEIPVIMLTARGEEDHKVQGLDAGADDYMTKPFSTRELVSRIKAVLRRANALSGEKTIDANGLMLDPVSQRVSFGDSILDMGPTEYRLLAFFMTHPERAYTRAQLLDQVWGGMFILKTVPSMCISVAYAKYLNLMVQIALYKLFVEQVIVSLHVLI